MPVLSPLDLAYKLSECINKRKSCIEELISMYENGTTVLDPETVSKREELSVLRLREDELTRILHDMWMIEWKCSRL